MKFKSLNLLIGLILLGSCQKEGESEIRQTFYEPILISRPNLEASIKLTLPQEMKNPGKIYLKDNIIYIVEKYKGIHILDNSDRINPKKVGFIQISGCLELAVKDNNLYADNAVDLVTISVENKNEIKVTGRIKDVFPEFTPPDNDIIPEKYRKGYRPENTIIVAWKEASK